MQPMPVCSRTPAPATETNSNPVPSALGVNQADCKAHALTTQ